MCVWATTQLFGLEYEDIKVFFQSSKYQVLVLQWQNGIVIVLWWYFTIIYVPHVPRLYVLSFYH